MGICSCCQEQPQQTLKANYLFLVNSQSWHCQGIPSILFPPFLLIYCHLAEMQDSEDLSSLILSRQPLLFLMGMLPLEIYICRCLLALVMSNEHFFEGLCPGASDMPLPMGHSPSFFLNEEVDLDDFSVPSQL